MSWTAPDERTTCGRVTHRNPPIREELGERDPTEPEENFKLLVSVTDRLSAAH